MLSRTLLRDQVTSGATKRCCWGPPWTAVNSWRAPTVSQSAKACISRINSAKIRKKAAHKLRERSIALRSSLSSSRKQESQESRVKGPPKSRELFTGLSSSPPASEIPLNPPPFSTRSPDGENVIYFASTETGKRVLFMLRWEGSALTSAGTEGASLRQFRCGSLPNDLISTFLLKKMLH